MDEHRGEVIVYEALDGGVRVDVRLEHETVWLSLNQIAELFGRDKSVISRHLGNVFSSGELEREAVVAENATTAADGKTYQVEYFNLDAILSVGYRVNSQRGTQFRIWATRTLRDHLLRGYPLHQKRLAERGLGEVDQAVRLLARTLTSHDLVTDEGRAVLDVVQRYTRAWRLLLEYDEERLAERPSRPAAPAVELTLDEARAAVRRLRDELTSRREAGALFGQERGDALALILGAIEQTFGGEPLYPSVQARAASPALLRHQGPSVRRRQQAHRVATLPRVPAAPRPAAARRRRTVARRQRDGGSGVADRGERAGAEGPARAPGAELARGRPGIG